MLDGEASLIASGLKNYDARVMRVSVPRGVTPLRGAGLDIRRTRRWREEPGRTECPHSRPAHDPGRHLGDVVTGEASLLLTLTVQQGMTTADLLGEALLDVRRDRRLRLLHSVARPRRRS